MSKCLENIAKLGGSYCPGDICKLLQPDINRYCQSHNMGPDEPYPTWGPDGKCWCCCSCFAYGTPIEVEPGLYKLIQSIGVGEKVLATGPALGGWAPAEVTHLGGIAPEVQVDFMLLGQFRLANGEIRLLIASADHLFLNAQPDGATLVPFSALRPGHLVRTADGGEASVVLTSYIEYSGGVRHVALGPYDPAGPLDGHLLNSNGLVTADLSVQLAYYAEALPETMVERADGLPPIGSAEFHAAYDTAAYTEFVNDPALWPPDCRPILTSLMNIPLSALGFLTREQAEEVERAMGPQDLGNSMLLTQALYLFGIFRGTYKDIAFVVDWANTTPNAWYFMDYRQRYVVVSGGLLRVPGLMLHGLSIVLSHLVANSRGIGCTAEADWEGMRNELREVWYGDLFFEAVTNGIPQIEGLFGLITGDGAAGDPGNICLAPSLDCRIESLWAGVTMSGLPGCAVPPPDFAVAGAQARGLNEVRVTFSRPYNQPSASDPANYVLEPVVPTRAVTFDPDSADTVLLTVESLTMGAAYTVTVHDVFSIDGKPLAAGHASAAFTAENAS